MSDEADQAFLAEQEAIAKGVRRVVRQTNLPFTGACRNCEGPLERPNIFCDADCRDDYQHRQERRRLNFKV